jgi:hypothetical protein
VEQRLIRRPALTKSHLLHDDHDRVRQLILHTLQAASRISSGSSVISPWSAASLRCSLIKASWASSRSCC